jgi:inner membrane protein
VSVASIGHIFVGMAAGRVYGWRDEPRWAAAWMIRFSALSLLPDIDAIAFVLRIPYEAPWGHRGATHSPVFALLVAALFTAILALVGPRAFGARDPASGADEPASGAASKAARRAQRRRLFTAFVAAFLVTASHGVLDALTDGGKGVAFLWPFDTHRFLLPWRPIPVAPIGGALFRTAEGWRVLFVETLASLPLIILAFWPRAKRSRSS